MNMPKKYSLDFRLGLFILFRGLFKMNPKFSFGFLHSNAKRV